MSSTKIVFFRLIGKTRWPPRALIGWDTFDFFSETTEGNAMKLDRKQDLNVLYQVCVFLADRKTKMAAPASDWLRHYWLLLWNAEPNGEKLNRKQEFKVLYQVCVFRADRKNKMAAMASDLLRHFWLFLWNCWKEFDETWQEARSQCPLASLCFSGWSENQDGCPGLWLVEKKEEIWLSPVTKTPTPTEQSKKQRDNIKTPPKTLITQLLRTDLGRSVGVTAVTQLVWLNRFTSAQPSH